MKTVLGISVTSARVGWVLVDGAAPEALTLDDDAFGLDSPSDLEGRVLAAVRGAQSIAAATGHEIESIGITCSDEVAERSAGLIEMLKKSGCEDIRSVRLSADVAAADSVQTAAARAVTEDVPHVEPELGPEPLPDADAEPGDAVTMALPVHVDDSTARSTPAFAAAHAVATDAVPAAGGGTVYRLRRRIADTSPAKIASLAGAAAVTAVIALLAVGSQFVGADGEGPVAANQPVSPAAGTSQIVSSIPVPAPQAQEMAAVPKPEPAQSDVPPPVYSEPIVPLSEGQPAALPVIPVAPEQVPAPAEQLPAVEHVPTAPAAPVAGLPVDAPTGPLPGPAPEAVAPVPAAAPTAPAPEQHVVVPPADVPPPPPPLDPVQSAINSFFNPPAPPAPAPAPVP